MSARKSLSIVGIISLLAMIVGGSMIYRAKVHPQGDALDFFLFVFGAGGVFLGGLAFMAAIVPLLDRNRKG